jgi:glycosyltransferase involved in cell wall biosynthesis
MASMRVAFFIPSPSRGAFAASFAGLAWALRAQGVRDVKVLYYLGEIDPRGCHFPGNVEFVRLRGGRGLWAIRDLRRYVNSFRPDFVISAPVFVNLLAIVASLFSRWRRSGGRLIITHHHPIQLAHENCKKDNKYLVKLLYRLASGSFGVSPESVADACREACLDARKVPCIPNIVAPVSLSDAEQTHPWLDEKDRFTFVSASRLVKLKNIELLLDAFADLVKEADARLLVCGDGPERERLQSLIRTLGLEGRALLCGYVPNPRLFMKRADAFVLASNEEGFGQVLTEAMSVGCPVIATRAQGGGTEYVLEDGAHGLLVPCGDREQLRRAMRRMMEERVRAEYAEKALRRAQAFLPEQVGRDLVEFLVAC